MVPGNQPASYTGGSIQRVELATGRVETLYTACDGRPLRGPNDLVFDAQGGFWFTDHGKTRPRDRDRTGVFYALPDGSSIREVIFPLDAPNGIGLSPDGRRLYVAETHTGRVFWWEIVGPGVVRPNPFSPQRRPPADRPARDAAARLDGDRRGGQRLRRDARERRHHDHLAGRLAQRARADAGSAHHEPGLRRARSLDRLHHALGHRQAGGDAVEDARPAPRVLEQR